MVRRYSVYAAIMVCLSACLATTAARAQSRIDDKDLARLMQNVKDDAQPFRKSFASALKKSTIRGTSQEKDARQLGTTFVKQSESALDTFKKKHRADDQVAAMVDTAGQIDHLVNSLSLNPVVTEQWEKVRTELHQVAAAFNVQDSYQAAPGAS